MREPGPEGGAASTTRSTTTTAPVLTPEMQAKIDEAKQAIIAGTLVVKPYEQ